MGYSVGAMKVPDIETEILAFFTNQPQDPQLVQHLQCEVAPERKRHAKVRLVRGLLNQMTSPEQGITLDVAFCQLVRLAYLKKFLYLGEYRWDYQPDGTWLSTPICWDR
mgnify:CR=1 FL=1